MFTSTVVLVVLSLFLGTGVWLFFLWAVQKGEFDEAEEAKYRMLEEDDPGPNTKENDNEN